ncbi:importin-9-like isoform X1 [Acropora millepora]|uniref:importin-9-like isoform X1 n=1 Tax=Acropora millepora TaxID=45264 RepID=UPI001CF28B9F|nr:importin-9-like isoform X1 [Acropora millepora]
MFFKRFRAKFLACATLQNFVQFNMAAVEDRNRSLKQALVESLSAILSPDQQSRQTAEEQLKVLEVTEEFGVHLAELTVDREGALAIRQLASVVLKQYVEAHWTIHSEKFQPPETTEAAKAEIRRLLPGGLQESISKVRSSVAYAISAIAHWDWPEAWPDLFGHLMQALTSGDGNLVHGAMRVLTEFCREVTDIQMPHVAPVILPEMYKIFIHAELYSIRTRSRAADIFNTCASLICAMEDDNLGVAKKILFPIMPQFTQAFVQVLALADSQTVDCGLKMEALKALTTLVKNFPKQMAPHLTEILPHMWKTLTQSADHYVRTVVNYTDDADDPIDSDGEVLGFENLVFSVFEFIHGLIETPKFKKTVKTFLDELIYFLVLYMQITEDQVQVWTSNPNQFVEDEDDDTFSFSVRIAAQDVLLAVAADFHESAVSLTKAINRHLQEASERKNKGDINWWKVHESSMLAMGCIKALIIEKVANGKVSIDMTSFLTQVVLADLREPVSPFLIGQALWVASRFTPLMSPELLTSFLEASVTGLQSTQLPAVTISAVRAVYEFCAHLKSSENIQILMPYLPKVMDCLLSMATQSTDDVLALVLESLRIVMSVNKEFTTSCEGRITPLTIALFIKYAHDAALIPLIEDLFKELALIEACNKLLMQRFLPTIVSIFQSPPDKTPLGINAVCMDILGFIIQCTQPPLSEPLLNSVFPVVVNTILASDDNSVLQSGGQCLRAFVFVSPEQIISWRDSQGTSAISYIVRATSHLLDPRAPEFTASFVGRLVTTLIKNLGNNLGEHLDLLLRGVLSKLQQAETLSIIQSLVLAFLHLMNTQLERTLDFLSGVPDPTGKSALEYVIKIWCARQPEFFGVYDSKVSTMALCNVLQFFVNTGDKRLSSVIVKGERIIPQDEVFSSRFNTGIRTRSRAAKIPEQWTMIPVPVKLFKLIINELGTLLESAAATSGENGDGESDDGEGWEDVDDEEEHIDVGSGSAFAPASDFVGFDLDDVEDEDEDDPEVKNDPLYLMDLQNHLIKFLQNFAQQQCYPTYFQALNAQEKHTLSKIGVPT